MKKCHNEEREALKVITFKVLHEHANTLNFVILRQHHQVLSSLRKHTVNKRPLSYFPKLSTLSTSKKRERKSLPVNRSLIFFYFKPPCLLSLVCLVCMGSAWKSLKLYQSGTLILLNIGLLMNINVPLGAITLELHFYSQELQ